MNFAKSHLLLVGSAVIVLLSTSSDSYGFYSRSFSYVQDDSLGYFPLIVGSIYDYDDANCQPSQVTLISGPGYIQYFALTVDGEDYVMVPGLYWRNDTVRVNSNGDIVFRYRGVDELFFKLSADSGETWQTTLPVSDYQPFDFLVTMRSRTATVRIEDWEFTDCLEIHFQEIGSSLEITYYLAPNIGIVLKCTDMPWGLREAWVGDKHYPITSVEPTVVYSFELEQNYPNPFNPATQFRYNIQHTGFVSLKVFDLLGREVAVLVNEEKLPGSYSVSWNAGNMPSGVYFSRLESNGSSLMQKMMLVR